MISKLWKERGYFSGGSDARMILRDDEVALLPLWRDMRAEVEREDLPLGVATKDPNRRWAITGRTPIGWHVVAVCYATAAIFLGWWPWNFVLLLLLFPISNRCVRFYAFHTVAAKEPMRWRESHRRGSPT
jgi:hypothetical protein